MARERLAADDRKAQIAEAALRLIAAEGASRLTALGLARSVGVSDAALFRHFEGMDAIVDAAIERFGELLEQSLAEASDDPIERLRAFFVHRLALVRDRPEVLQLAFNERLADAAGESGARRVRAIVGRSRAHVLGCLEQAREEGLVRDDLPVEMLAWTVFGFVRGASQLARAARRAGLAPAPEDVWRGLATLLQARSRDAAKNPTPRQPKQRPARPRGARP